MYPMKVFELIKILDNLSEIDGYDGGVVEYLYKQRET